MLTVLFLSASSLLAQDLWDGTTIATSFHSGSGTVGDPYQIRTGAELMYFVGLVNAGDNFSGKTVRMMNDIDMNGNNFSIADFAGTFDGGGNFLTVLLGAKTNDPLFRIVSGRIHHLGIKATMLNQYNGVYYGDVALVRTLQETGIIEDCHHTIGGANIFSFVPSLAFNNYGIIRNCYADGSYNIYGGYHRDGSQLVYYNYSSGVVENCYAYVNKGIKPYYYDAIPLVYDDKGTTTHCSTNISELNTWVDTHPDHSRWTDDGTYKLVDFNPSSTCRIDFIDELFNTSVSTATVAKGEPVGNLPVPNADCTFIGWTRSGELVQSTDIVNGNWTLFARWEQRIRKQPTTDDMSIEIDDADHASVQWYVNYGSLQRFEDWQSTNHGKSSTSSTQIDFTAAAGQTLSFAYNVSSEQDYDVFYAVLNGTVLMKASGTESANFQYEIPTEGDYELVLRYSKDDETNVGNDMVTVTNITLSSQNYPLNCRTTTLPQNLIAQDGLYYCKVTYSNTAAVLTSDIIECSGNFNLHFEDMAAYRGESVVMPIRLENKLSVKALELDIYMPEALTLGDVALGSRGKNHQQTFQQLTSGKWHVTLSGSETFSGNEGAIAYLIVTADDNHPVTKYTVALKNIKLTDSADNILQPTDHEAILTLCTVGDMTGDGNVSVSDVTKIIDIIIGKEQQ